MIVLPSCGIWKMEYGQWNHHEALTVDPLTAGVFSNVRVIKNNFISKLVLRGGLQFAALPGVTIKDFSTKQFIKKKFYYSIYQNVSQINKPHFLQTVYPIGVGGLLHIDPKLQVLSGIPV